MKVLQHPLFTRFYLPAIAFEIGRGILLPLFPLYVNSFDVSYAIVGLVLAGEAIGLILMDLPLGAVARRVGDKTLFLSGLGLAAVCTFLMIFAPSVWVLLALRVLLGMGRSSYAMARHTYISDWTASGANRGRALSSLGGTFRLGAFVGPSLAALVVTVFDIRAGFVASSLLTLLAFVLILRYVETAAPQPHAEQALRTQNVMAVTFRRNWQILLAAGTGQFLGMVTRIGRGAILPLYAADVLGLDAATVSLVIGISSIGDVVTFYFSGTLMDRLGRKWAIVPCFALQGMGMAFVPLTTGAVALGVVAFLMGMGNGIGSGTMMTLGADLSPPDARGEFLGMWRLIGDVGSMGGPILVGAAAQALTLGVAPFFVMASGIGAALVFAFLMPETRHYTAEPVTE